MKLHIAIVGFGYAGAVLADRLLRQHPAGVSINIFDKCRSMGEGRAYQGDLHTNLLNRPAELMYLREPQDFLHAAGVPLGSFAPRPVFGDFLRAEMKKMLAEHRTVARYTPSEVISIRPDGLSHILKTADGNECKADIVVLAIGSQAQSLPYVITNRDRYTSDPYPVSRLLALDARQIGIVGTRHSAVDVALGLLEHRDDIEVVITSRRSRIPVASGAYTRVEPRVLSEDYLKGALGSCEGGLRGIVRLIDRELRAHDIDCTLIEFLRTRLDTTSMADRGRLFGVISSLNAQLAVLWSRLTPLERERFDMLWRHYWADARVPIPACRVERLTEMQRQGRLSIFPGLKDVRETVSGLELVSESASVNVDHLINAAGPGSQHHSTLVDDLMRYYGGGLHPQGGLCCDFETCLLSGQQARSSIFVTGQLSSGTYFGVSSIDAIQDQVRRISSEIQGRFKLLAASGAPEAA
ncbi:hypothetical protein ERN12_09500 [Rhodobacteraceae bacterium]|nr:hypothetical protein ERN12_09500 [Paracoccaceae bacterium]